MDKDRFQKVYSQGLVNVAEILVDTQTGVNYLYYLEWERRGADAPAGPGGKAGHHGGGQRPGAALRAQPWGQENENSLTTAGKSHIIHI